MGKDPSKTEDATPKRIKKARDEGNVARSQELPKLITIIAGLTMLKFWVSFMAEEMQGIFRHFMTQAVYFEVTDSNIVNLFRWAATELARIVLPIILFIAVAVFIALRVQVGKLWTTKVFKPKLSKFNLIKGLKRMFASMQTLVRLFKSLLQAICIGWAAWYVLKSEMATFPSLYYMDAMGVAAYILKTGSKVVYYALIPMLAIGIFDLWYTRHDYNENLKMSKSEVKDERKQADGDPLVKAEIRKKMQQVTGRRMMQNVPQADVVITNPTHIAVALKYDPDEFPAPIIVAMGAGKVAEKIREIAKEHRVPIKENKVLARALYKQAEVGDMIPEDLFQAVAAILAQIWRAKGKR